MSRSALLKTAVLLGVFAVQGAYAAGWRDVADPQSCGVDSGTAGVFSAYDGKVTLFGDKTCNLTFYNSPMVGATNFSSAKDGCSVTLPDNTKTTLKPSGEAGKKKALEAFSETTSNRCIRAYPDGRLEYSSTANQWGGCNSPSTATLTTDGSQATLAFADGSITVRREGNALVFPGGDYGTISWETLAPNRLAWLKFSGPIRARTISGGNCNPDMDAKELAGLHFARDSQSTNPKQNFINLLFKDASGNTFGDGCAIKVDQERGAKTTLNVLGKLSAASTAAYGLKFAQSGSCINFDGKVCLQKSNEARLLTWEEMASQHPEQLDINVYNGKLETSDRSYIAANVYVDGGGYEATAASGTVLVGQVVAAYIHVTQNNNGAQFFAQSASSTRMASAPYSLTPPAADAVVTPGRSYIYRAMQRDYKDDAATQPGTSGHLRAYLMKEDGSHDETYVWDAAERMTLPEREQKIVTEVAIAATDKTGSAFIALKQASGLVLGSADFGSNIGVLQGSVDCILNPACENGRRLAGRADNALVGVPWRTHPIIVGEPNDGSVLFATDDGILYSIDKVSGNLNWGWIPRDVVPHVANPTAMAQKHPWGQISTVVDAGKTYVTGTVLGGQLHFSIEVSENGKSLRSVAWLDHQAGLFSPGSDNWGSEGGTRGRPLGGAAPVSASVSETGKVAYLVGTATGGHKLVHRAVGAAGRDRTVVDFTESVLTTVDAVPAVFASSNLWYRSDEEIYFGTLEGRIYKTNIEGRLSKLKNAGGTTVSAEGGGAVYWVNGARLASSQGNALMLVAQSESRMTVLKYADDAWSQAWYTGIGSSSDKGADGVAPEQAPVPYINQTTAVAYLSGAPTIVNGKITTYYTVESSDCEINGYAFGPLDLKTGVSAIAGVTFRRQGMTGLVTHLGYGVATGGTVVEIIRNGVKSVGVLAGTAGDGMQVGNTGLFEEAAGSAVRRLNWRELTNFF